MSEAVVRYYSVMAGGRRKADLLRRWRRERRLLDPSGYADELRRNREGAQARRLARREALNLGNRCAFCNGPNPPRSTMGRAPKYCTAACKRKARRLREKRCESAVAGRP